MVFAEIAYTDILGIPAIAWGGIVTFLLLAATLALGYLSMHGHGKLIKTHILLAYVTLIAALFHGLLGVGASLGW